MASKSQDTTSSQTQNSSGTQTVNTKPWNYTDLDSLYSTAAQAYANVNKDPASTVAGFTPAQTQGQADALAAAPGLGQGADALRALAGTFTSPSYLDVQNDPAFQASLQASLDPLTKALTTKVLPQIAGNANADGAYGGSRMGVANALATNDYTTNAADALASATQAEIARRSAQAANAGSLYAQANQLALDPSVAELGVGGQQQQQAQAQATATTTAPLNGLSALMAALSVGANGQVGTTTSQGTTSGTSNSSTTSTDPLAWTKLLAFGAAGA